MKKLIHSSVFLIIALITCTVSLFAWFVGGNTAISNVEFSTGSVEVESELYFIKDFNKDGIVDVGNGISETIRKSTGSENVLKSIVIQNAVPGNIFTYRLIAKNQTAVSIYFALSFRNLGNLVPIQLNDVLTVSASIVSLSKNTPQQEGNILSEQNLETYANRNSISLSGTDIPIFEDKSLANGADCFPVIEMAPYDENIDNTIIIDIKFKFETLANLKVINPTFFNGLNDLNQYANLKLDSGYKFYFEFRQGVDDRT